MFLEKYISKLLFEHDCVIVPGLGGFIANYTPAKIHPVHHTFTPPARILVFNASLCNNDGLLADAIRVGQGISFSEALDLISAEVSILTEKLNNNETINLAQIGSLYHDREKNIQFSTENTVNYNAGSFGLTTFTSPAIKREGIHEKLSRKFKPAVPGRPYLRLPATVKWAAVFLPLVTIGLWSAFNPGKINSFYNNYTSLIPAGNNKTLNAPVVKAKPKPATKIVINLPPVEEPAISEIKTIDVGSTPVTARDEVYFIIAGAFSIEENAVKYTETLKQKGYNSSIAGINRRGLHMVSIEGFSNRDQAMQKINEYRNSEFPGAWLLSKK